MPVVGLDSVVSSLELERYVMGDAFVSWMRSDDLGIVLEPALEEVFIHVLLVVVLVLWGL